MYLCASLEQASTAVDPEMSLGEGPDGLELRVKDVQKQRGRLADAVKQVGSAVGGWG
jgi:hypothetical protein